LPIFIDRGFLQTMGLVEFFSFDWLPGWPAGIDAFFDWTGMTFWIALVCAIAGAYILSQKTTEQGAFSFPINLGALFLGAVLANWIGRETALPLESGVHVSIILSLVGMSFVGLTIIWLVKKG
jgi:hypothetical protein